MSFANLKKELTEINDGIFIERSVRNFVKEVWQKVLKHIRNIKRYHILITNRGTTNFFQEELMGKESWR